MRPRQSSSSLPLPATLPRPRPRPRPRSRSLPPMALAKALPAPAPDRDAARRYHALSELLSTELGYLLDLRSLVSVYLRLLPVLKIRSSLSLVHASSSNPAIPYFARSSSQPPFVRTQSHPHLDPGLLLAESSLRVEKCPTRHLFSPADLDAITRNAEDILQFHERLVLRLHQVLSPLGISLSRSLADPPPANPLVDVHRAINAVSTVFVDHAASFELYQSFCSGHLEAFDLVRKVQHSYAAEWGAFELRCAAAIAEMRSSDVPKDFSPFSPSKRRLVHLCERRHSLSSLEALSVENVKAPMLSASESGHTDRESSRTPRLMFMDYMIKPIQRVCRYPLLFDQLQDRARIQEFSDGLAEFNSTLRNSQDPVRTALWTMRAVASLVDEARRQQDLFAKSVQIVSRITQGLLTSVASHSRPPQSVSLSTFLATLPPCRLSGSLDVIHYRGSNMARLGTVRAKYLGAFLFPGGFLVLVKVAKSKMYEPKLWFSLRGFELVDSNLDDVLLPSWFRLSSKTHMFEFAASCRREKAIWVDAIRRAVAEEATWSDEPPSSLHADVTASQSEDVQFDSISPLPTIQSIPELDGVESAIPSPGDGLPPPIVQRNSVKYDTTVLHARRSTIVAYPTLIPESNTLHLVRSTASAREQVDRGLLDVFSEKCLTARLHAHTNEEDLFEAQKVISSFSRSSSALTMASAMSVAAKNRLTKRESVLVPRKKSFVESNGIVADPESCPTPIASAAQKPVKKAQYPSKLKIVAMTKSTSHEGEEGGNELSVESPSPLSHCSSVSFATPATPLTVPPPLPSGKAESFHSHSEFLDVRRKDCVPKRSKSMIENVRGFFTSRSASPNTALTRESSTRSSVSNSSLLKWWSRKSFRRRARSAPGATSDELPSALTTRSMHIEATSSLLVTTDTDRPYSQPDLRQYVYSDTTRLSATEFGTKETRPRKFVRGSQRHWRASTGHEQESTLAPMRIRRNFSFLHRFTHGTRYYEDTPGNFS